LSPTFLEKHSILTSIKTLCSEIPGGLNNKSILDIGCGSQPYKNFFKSLGADYRGIDFKQYSKNESFTKSNPDYYFKESYHKNFRISNLKNKSFGMITSFQVLEHHPEPEIFFREANRLLKEGGYLIITFPFIWPLHEEPHDYQRLTHYKIKRIAEENKFKVIKILKRGGTFGTMSQILNVALFSTRAPLFLKRIIYVFSLLPLQYFFYLLDFFFKNNEDRKVFLGYALLLQKEK